MGKNRIGGCPPLTPEEAVGNGKGRVGRIDGAASELRVWRPHRRGKFWLPAGHRPASAQLRGHHEGQHDRQPAERPAHPACNGWEAATQAAA